MLDAIELERLGVPTANISTDGFLGSIREMCEGQGIGDYQVAVMQHPLTSLDGDTLRLQISALVPEIVSILTVTR